MRGIGWVVRLAVGAIAVGMLVSSGAVASHTPNPSFVTIAGSLQSELGCSGDWDPGCAATRLTYEANDDVWQGSWTVPGGSWEYKAALDNGWDENYGAGAQPGGANIGLSLAGTTTVKFYYDHKSHWIADNQGTTIAVAPGNFQSELGCSGDWDPSCLRSWLQDADDDGVYRFETTALPAGDYEAKVAINESWAENYGQNGVRDGANIPFRVRTDGAKVMFSYDQATHVLSIQAGHAADGNIEWDGLRHDSRATLYRAPGGAVPAGTPVKLRLRTFHDDVTGARLRLYDVNAAAQRILTMTRVASDVSCYQDSLASESCDYWQATVTATGPNVYWYRFIVTDGGDTDYYADNTAALDGGVGRTTDDPVDYSYALVAHAPSFAAPAWARSAFIYQIFPDRFRNGDRSNDPKTGDQRYDDPVLKLPWSTLPEGYCRNYADAATNCPWRFDSTPPEWSPTKESPRGRDYFGGDLAGVIDELNYLRDLGVDTIYFNPIFAAKSNHRYDTADYRRIDPYLGSTRLFETLTEQARRRGIRVIVDGVFNHMSSDSPFFDRYHHYATSGACESLTSPWRGWFVFRNSNVPCSGADYEGWFGFDSIPVLKKSNPAVQDYFVKGQDSITRLWLGRGAAGWRMDVSGDPSFPVGYWQAFRDVVKQTNASALIVGELWQKDSTTLRHLSGDIADSTMNYRLRDAVWGLLAPQGFDAKGFGDSGRILAPSEAAARLASIYEDYPKAAAYSLMNLLDSHDTARLLWALTPGAATRADKEQNAANLADGKTRLRLASLVQFTVPGAPTVYYGDEVGMTGDDDPDDRRTYPWESTGGNPDEALLQWYRGLGAARRALPALTQGDFRILSSDDACGTLAFTRKAPTQRAIVAVNRGAGDCMVELPDGPGSIRVATPSVQLDGKQLHLPARSGAIVAADGDFDPPAAPSGLQATAGNGQVSLSWNGVDGATSYGVYRSPVSGGGYVLAGTATGTTFTDTALRNARTYYYVVRALESAGNESVDSNEVSAVPHATIGYAVLQWPKTMTWTLSAYGTDNVYGQVYVAGVTDANASPSEIEAAVGFGPPGSSPNSSSWTWFDAAFNTRAGNNYEYVAKLYPEAAGTYDYAYRFSTDAGLTWTYGDQDGVHPGDGYDEPGVLTVQPPSDTTAPAAPTDLRLVSGSPGAIELAWNANSEPDLYGYDVLRADSPGGPYTKLARVQATEYVDTTVTEGATYHYVVRAVDTSLNRSGNSNEVSATAALRMVAVTFNVTVPGSTDSTGRNVYIAGTLQRLDPPGPEWNPGGVALTRVDATHWAITLNGREGTQLEYKYTLGDWEHVEKGGACDELANRQLTLSYGPGGTQTVNDTVLNWRNVAPCGN